MRFCCVLFFIAIAAPAIATADPHPMSSGATPAPTTDAQIAMTQEDLDIQVDERSTDVKASVTLENRGEATSTMVGFPCSKGEDAGTVDVPCSVKLTVTVGGKKVRIKKHYTDKKQTHWVWKMSLQSAAKTSVVVSYRAPLINDRYRSPSLGMGMFSYRLTTGARWAGPIGKLRITLHHMQDSLLFVSPAGYKREAGKITWELENHEPTEEVAIVPMPSTAAHLATAMKVKNAAAFRKRIVNGDYHKQDVESLIAKFSRSTDDDQWMTIISRVGGIAKPDPARVAAVRAESTKILQDLAASAKP